MGSKPPRIVSGNVLPGERLPSGARNEIRNAPDNEQTLRLISAFRRINDSKKRAWLVEQAENLARK